MAHPLLYKEGSLYQIDENHLAFGYGPPKKTNLYQSGFSFYTPPFFLKDTPPWIRYPHQSLLPFKKEPSNHTLAPFFKKMRFDEACFETQFKKAQILFSKHHVKKIVLYSFFSAPKEEDFLDKLFQKALCLSQKRPSTRLIASWEKETGLLGITPEVLFKTSFQGIESEALAGTRDAFLKQSEEKLTEEHSFTETAIGEDLSPYGEVLKTKTNWQKYGSLEHLHTRFFLKPTNFPFFPLDALLKTLHPTPALGTWPKSALPFLEEFERDFPRGRFGAPFGIRCGTYASFHVAIRTLFWDKENVFFFVGAGVTPKSTYADEKEELFRKWHAFQSLF